MKTSGLMLTTKNLVLVPQDDSRYWNKPWYINKKVNGYNIGKATFMGKPENYAVELEVTFKSDYVNKEFDKEVYETLSDWALGKENVFYVEAYPDADNHYVMNALNKAKFKEDESVGKKTRFVKKREGMPWLIICLSMFLSAGFAIGFTVHDIVTGLIIGGIMGIAAGAFLTYSRNKRLKGAEKEWRESKKKRRGKR